MTRHEMIEHMSMTFVGDDVWLLIDEPARERRRERMARVLDVVEPLIRASTAGTAPRCAFPGCDQSEEAHSKCSLGQAHPMCVCRLRRDHVNCHDLRVAR